MATTTAQVTLTSSDLLSDSLNMTSSFTLYNAGTTTGMSKTTGLARYSTGSTSETKLLEGDDYTSAKAHKLYIKNTSATRTEYVDILVGTIGGTWLGRLYGGEWGLIPWSGNNDVNLTASTTTIVVEWMLIYE